MSASDLSIEQRMYQFSFGYMAMPAIAVAAKLNIPDAHKRAFRTIL